MMAGLPQMQPDELAAVVTAPLRIELTGPGGGTWTITPAGDDGVIGCVEGADGDVGGDGDVERPRLRELGHQACRLAPVVHRHRRRGLRGLGARRHQHHLRTPMGLPDGAALLRVRWPGG